MHDQVLDACDKVFHMHAGQTDQASGLRQEKPLAPSRS